MGKTELTAPWGGPGWRKESLAQLQLGEKGRGDFEQEGPGRQHSEGLEWCALPQLLGPPRCASALLLASLSLLVGIGEGVRVLQGPE